MSTSNGTPAVQTKDVWKIYPQEPNPVTAVRGVSLEVFAEQTWENAMRVFKWEEDEA